MHVEAYLLVIQGQLCPLCSEPLATTTPGLLVVSNGSPGMICQWSNTHCGKALPPVLERRSAVKPEIGKSKVLHSLGNIHQEVGASSIGSEAPDLSGLTDVPLKLLSKVTGTGLDVLTLANITLLNVFCQTIGEGTSLHEQTVVLVGRL
ncbi:hypothetical protein EYF80_030744 [Liparis tanakae]|uniref:Uncharacterized protein n=1 Tax=Liparis tanakae TaxID=230148 RepID=A0A4Z2GZR1_9TELE|nr:hypothetical protein EYF80_030744 [Liparis tanakae]